MKQALIVIDIQKDYFEGGAMPLPQAQETLKNILGLRAKFLSKDKPVIYIKQASEEELGFLVKNTQGADFHPELLPMKNRKEYVVNKTTPNSFYNTA